MGNCHFLVNGKADAWAVVVKEKADAYANFDVYQSDSYTGEDHAKPENLLFNQDCMTLQEALAKGLEPTASAFIKWDGCSSWTFEEGLHLCGARNGQSFARMIEFVFDVARKEIPMWEDL